VVDSLVEGVERQAQREHVDVLEQEVATLRQSMAEMQAAADASDKMFADATALLQDKDELAQDLKVCHACLSALRSKNLVTNHSLLLFLQETYTSAVSPLTVCGTVFQNSPACSTLIRTVLFEILTPVTVFVA
jgi:hypothetical protein